MRRPVVGDLVEVISAYELNIFLKRGASVPARVIFVDPDIRNTSIGVAMKNGHLSDGEFPEEGWWLEGGDYRLIDHQPHESASEAAYEWMNT
jgi:hypothetical protein